MTRRRPAEYDYICLRCGCACAPTGTHHLGGGNSNMRACREAPVPVLRAEFEREIAGDLALIRHRWRATP